MKLISSCTWIELHICSFCIECLVFGASENNTMHIFSVQMQCITWQRNCTLLNAIKLKREFYALQSFLASNFECSYLITLHCITVVWSLHQIGATNKSRGESFWEPLFQLHFELLYLSKITLDWKFQFWTIWNVWASNLLVTSLCNPSFDTG